MLVEEPLGHQVQDAATLHHVVTHRADELVPQDYECEYLEKEEDEEDDLCVLLILVSEAAEGCREDPQLLLDYLEKIELLGGE